ncbi:MAG: PAS domain S-box protein [Candidatus Schekmanbacteria bacterium]|nr:PAS domain S-box protein [Candidatus Schekmanbacteria bacterium]
MNRQLELNELIASLFVDKPIAEKLKLITDGVVKIFHADFCRIWMLRKGDLCSRCMHRKVAQYQHKCRDTERCLHLLASSGRYTHIDGKGHRRVPVGCYKIGLIAAAQTPKFLTNDVQNDSRVHNRQWAQEIGLTAFAGYRLLAQGGETVGVMALFSQQPVTPDEDNLLEALANTTAQIIITEQSREALKDSELYLRSIVESAPDAIISLDGEGLITAWNPKAETFFGWSAAQAVGMNFPQLVLVQDYREGFIRCGDFQSGECVSCGKRCKMLAVKQNKEVFPIEISPSPPHKIGRQNRNKRFYP